MRAIGHETVPDITVLVLYCSTVMTSDTDPWHVRSNRTIDSYSILVLSGLSLGPKSIGHVL